MLTTATIAEPRRDRQALALRVLSEDFASGSTVEGLTFIDPFDVSLDLRTL